MGRVWRPEVGQAAGINLRAGQVFADKYEIVSTIARGPLSSIYRAIQRDVDREVALKLLAIPQANNLQVEVSVAEMRKRFLREAKLVSKLRQPTTITMFDYGQTAEGQLFMVLEYVEGASLAALLNSGSKFSAERTVKVVSQVLESLEEAHGLGILHRDIKPANMMVYAHLGQDDLIKLLDFGLAKLTRRQGADDEDLTRTGTVVGTIRYMSPEQMTGRTLTPACDLYALGLVTYELLTGEHPIPDVALAEVYRLQTRGPSFTLPASLAVPPALRRVVHKMLVKDLDQRYGSAAEARRDLLAAMADLSAWSSHDITDADETTSLNRKGPTANTGAPRGSREDDAREDTLSETRDLDPLGKLSGPEDTVSDALYAGTDFDPVTLTDVGLDSRDLTLTVDDPNEELLPLPPGLRTAGQWEEDLPTAIHVRALEPAQEEVVVGSPATKDQSKGAADTTAYYPTSPALSSKAKPEPADEAAPATKRRWTATAEIPRQAPPAGADRQSDVEFVALSEVPSAEAMAAEESPRWIFAALAVGVLVLFVIIFLVF